MAPRPNESASRRASGLIRSSSRAPENLSRLLGLRNAHSRAARASGGGGGPSAGGGLGACAPRRFARRARAVDAAAATSSRVGDDATPRRSIGSVQNVGPVQGRAEGGENLRRRPRDVRGAKGASAWFSVRYVLAGGYVLAGVPTGGYGRIARGGSARPERARREGARPAERALEPEGLEAGGRRGRRAVEAAARHFARRGDEGRDGALRGEGRAETGQDKKHDAGALLR